MSWRDKMREEWERTKSSVGGDAVGNILLVVLVVLVVIFVLFLLGVIAIDPIGE
jgi:hypothetical protein